MKQLLTELPYLYFKMAFIFAAPLFIVVIRVVDTAHIVYAKFNKPHRI